jgi:predicted permease
MKPHLWLIHMVGVIVPRRLRLDWRQEWEAELRSREELLSDWDRLDWRGKWDLLWRSTSAFWDAWLLQPKRLEDELFQDLRFSLRMLLKSKSFTMVAVLSLALGIGANTAIFSLVDAVVLRTLPVRAPEELTLFNWLSGPKRMSRNVYGDIGRDVATGLTTSTSFSYLSFERLRDHPQGLVEVFAFTPLELSVNADAQPEVASGQLVSGGYYDGLGAKAALGRTISVEDDRASAAPVAVITHRYWERRFALDPAVVGKTMTVNGIPCTIIGVTPPGFFGALQVGQSPDVTIPLSLEPRFSPGNSKLGKPWVWWLRVMGRLKSGVTKEQARAALEGNFQQSAQEGWTAAPNSTESQGPRDIPRLRAADGGQGLNESRRKYSQSLMILMTIVGLVLLIACANVANLLLARAATRRKEIAMRLALGASRFRLIRQLLTESLALALIGGALGVAFAYRGRSLLLALQPWGANDLALDLKLDFRVLSFTIVVSLLTGLAFGLAPALRATRIALIPALKDDGRNPGGGRSTLSKAIVTAQVALSMILLITAGLFTRTLYNLQALEAGFNTENMIVFGLDSKSNRYQGEQLAQLYRRILERLDVVPGVQSTTLSSNPILAGSRNDAPIRIQGRSAQSAENGRALVNDVAVNFLDTLGVPILRGRGFSPADERAAGTAVINQALANKYFANEDPIGRRLFVGGADDGVEIEIIGVAGNAKYFELRGEMPPTVYLPYFQDPSGAAYFAARTIGDPASLMAPIRQAVREIANDIPVVNLQALHNQVEKSWTQERFFANLSGFFGLLALSLASIGLYGVLSYGVARRTNEIGVRMALGAERQDVVWLVMREALLLVAIGAGVGLAAALTTTRLLSNFLFGLAPHDPLTITLATLAMIAVAALAAWLPARRAANVDPMTALRRD